MQLCEEVLWWHGVEYGHAMTMDDIRARSRLAPIVLARADCMRRLRFEKGWSYPRIGRFFGMDHTTVMHNVNRSALKPVANKHGLSLPELKVKREYDRYRKANPKRHMGQVVGEVQPKGDVHV